MSTQTLSTKTWKLLQKLAMGDINDKKEILHNLSYAVNSTPQIRNRYWKASVPNNGRSKGVVKGIKYSSSLLCRIQR